MIIPTDHENSMKQRSCSNGDDVQFPNKRLHSDENQESPDLNLSMGNPSTRSPNFVHQSESSSIFQSFLQSQTLTPTLPLFGPPAVVAGVTGAQSLPIPSCICPPAAACSCISNQFNNPNSSSHSSTSLAPSVPAREASTPRVPRPPRARRDRTPAARDGDKTFNPPFPWATEKRATVHSLAELMARNIETISGWVQCRRCEKQYQMEFNLVEKFKEIAKFITDHKEFMRDRAPSVWMSPVLPNCESCHQENCVKPVIAEKKREINWLFLLLGQMLGCCTLNQLKYFCKHTDNHRTGAKDRVLYLTYLGLCKQLYPQGPFDR